MVVDQAARLHQGVGRRGADEAQAALLEVLGESSGLRGDRRDVAEGARGGADGRVGGVRPDQCVQLAVRPVGQHLGVGKGRLDLRAVADDPGVGEETFLVGVGELGDRVDLESGEGAAEPFPAAQDRQPGQSGLERLQAEPFEEGVVAVDGAAPFGVVVDEVVVGGQCPGAAQPAVGRAFDAGDAHRCGSSPDRGPDCGPDCGPEAPGGGRTAPTGAAVPTGTARDAAGAAVPTGTAPGAAGSAAP